MDMDYSKARYTVFDGRGQIVGRIDEDEYVRQGKHLIYRIDGAEVYEISGEFLAVIQGGVAMKPNGQTLFTIGNE